MTETDTTAAPAPTPAQPDPARPVALVTGATSGIGTEVARQLLAAGMDVLVGARDPERGAATVADLGPGAHLLLLEVTDAASITAAAAAVERLDVLVNNAGITPDAGPTTSMDLAALRATYETNVFAVVAVTDAFVPALLRSEHPRVVNVSSGTGSLAWSSGPNPQFEHRTGGSGAAYRSSKTALNALTLFYAQALEDRGVKVNALAPGLRATNLNSFAAAKGGDPAEAAAGVVALALLDDDGPTGTFVSFDGAPVPW